MNQTTSSLVQAARQRRIDQQNSGQSLPRILFVDDEERILHSMQALFRSHYDVVVSTDGQHALELLKHDHFHLLVSDQRMPNMLGVELLRQARDISPYTVRILLTGFADLTAIVGSVNEGEVYRYINKPWNNEELAAVVGDAVKVGFGLDKLRQSAMAKAPPPAANTALAQPDVTASVPSLAEGLSVLFVDGDAQLLPFFQKSAQLGCRAYSVRSATEALDLMQQHEIAIIVASIDGQDRDNINFMQLLKKEHPHVVLLAVASAGDSETVIGLVNSARVYRFLFRPIKGGMLKIYMESALKQVVRFRQQPELLAVQQAKKPASFDGAAVPGSFFSDRLRSIKNVFFASRA